MGLTFPTPVTTHVYVKYSRISKQVPSTTTQIPSQAMIQSVQEPLKEIDTQTVDNAKASRFCKEKYILDWLTDNSCRPIIIMLDQA
jgi:hypothetical protein